jgi:hypothetical protein
LIFPSNYYFSIAMNKIAILAKGKIKPTVGTNIDGKYDADISLL